MQSCRIEVSVLQTREEIVPLKPDWDRLAAGEKQDGVFRGYAWNTLWLKHIAPEAVPHVLKMTNERGEVVGIAPLCERGYEDRFFRVRSLGFTGREVVCGDCLDILAATGYEEEVRERMLEHIERMLGHISLVVLGECLRDSPTVARLDEWVRAKGWRAQWQEERVVPYIELPSSFAEYRQRISRNTRENLRRKGRQLLKAAGCSLVRLRGPDEVLPQLPHFFRLHEARWKSVGRKGVFAQPGFREFLRAFVAEAHPQTVSELYMIQSGDRPVAATLFFRSGEAVLYYQSGWDPASPEARLSPGFVLHGQAIADAISEGYRYFEFLRGDESYKKKFTTTAKRTTTLVLAGRGLKPRAYLAAMRAKEWGKSLHARIMPGGKRE